MKRRIENFYRDEEGHWVAELSCGHSQHMRHNPPFTQRPWIMSQAGRDAKIGTAIDCPLCDKVQSSSLVFKN